MAAESNPFTPLGPALTLRLAVTAANTQGTFTQPGNQIRLLNIGPNKCFVRTGPAAQTATTTDVPIASGATEVFTKVAGDLFIAAICDAAETATLFATLGEGS